MCVFLAFTLLESVLFKYLLFPWLDHGKIFWKSIFMGTDQFLNQISTLIFGWEIVDFVTMINQKSTSQPKINGKWTNCQPNFNHFSTLIFQLQTWLIFGWIVIEKLIFGWIVVEKLSFGWSLLQNQRFINQISTLRKVKAQHWEVDLCPLGFRYQILKVINSGDTGFWYQYWNNLEHVTHVRISICVGRGAGGVGK